MAGVRGITGLVAWLSYRDKACHTNVVVSPDESAMMMCPLTTILVHYSQHGDLMSGFDPSSKGIQR